MLLLAALLFQAALGLQEAGCGLRPGRDGFVLDAMDAVSGGATFLSSPPVEREEDCRRACCQEPRCNVALMGDPEGSGGPSCFLLDCLHRKELVCRFVQKEKFRSFVMDSVFEEHLSSGGPGPVALGGRGVVVQPGKEVTLSGIQSRAPGGATIVSYKWEQLKGSPPMTMEHTALADQLRVSSLTPGSFLFQLSVGDSDGRSAAAQVEVLVLSPEESQLHCLVPVNVGPCRASFPRWGYDSSTALCDTFVYGGCRGNRNNFLSKEECSAACSNVKGSSERSIHPSNQVEECNASCQPGQLICSNGCCLDATLECDGFPQCSDGSDEATCTTLNHTFSTLMEIKVNPVMARCTQPPKLGCCHDNLTRWYYNPLSVQCQEFTYRGCQGNDNNFESKDSCEATCKGITERSVFAPGVFEEQDEQESGSIAIAIVLAVAILVVLAVLAYFFLKAQRKRRSHQPVATAAAPSGPLSEDGETVVYRSTTKPV